MGGNVWCLRVGPGSTLSVSQLQDQICEASNAPPAVAPDQPTIRSGTRRAFQKGLPLTLASEDRFICTTRQLRRLRASEDVRNSVSHTRLQEAIQEILRQPEPLSKVKEMMKNNPEFAQFADICLQCIGIRDDEGACLL